MPEQFGPSPHQTRAMNAGFGVTSRPRPRSRVPSPAEWIHGLRQQYGETQVTPEQYREMTSRKAYNAHVQMLMQQELSQSQISRNRLAGRAHQGTIDANTKSLGYADAAEGRLVSSEARAQSKSESDLETAALARAAQEQQISESRSRVDLADRPTSEGAIGEFVQGGITQALQTYPFSGPDTTPDPAVDSERNEVIRRIIEASNMVRPQKASVKPEEVMGNVWAGAVSDMRAADMPDVEIAKVLRGFEVLSVPKQHSDVERRKAAADAFNALTNTKIGQAYLKGDESKSGFDESNPYAAILDYLASEMGEQPATPAFGPNPGQPDMGQAALSTGPRTPGPNDIVTIQVLDEKGNPLGKPFKGPFSRTKQLTANKMGFKIIPGA